MRDTHGRRFRLAMWHAFPQEQRPSLSIGELNVWLRKAWRSPWMKRHFPAVGTTRIIPTVTVGKVDQSRPGMAEIGLRNPNKVALLHCLVHYLDDRPGGVQHDRIVCRNFLLLVQHYLGREAAKGLKRQFQDQKVRFRKARELTPETRHRLRAQAAHMRSRNPRLVVKRRIRMADPD